MYATKSALREVLAKYVETEVFRYVGFVVPELKKYQKDLRQNKIPESHILEQIILRGESILAEDTTQSQEIVENPVLTPFVRRQLEM